VVFFLQSFFASLQKSPVFDEPPHIASGLSYLETRVFHANPQHPPLLKEMSALFLSLAGIHWPTDIMAQTLIQGGPQADKLEWPLGNNIIHQNGADRVLFWARLPFILLATLLGALIYWWGRELVGSAAALGALFLYAFDPTIIAHSYLVTTDVGLAAFTVLFLFALWRYLQQPVWQRLVLCGLAMGAVLCAKFSAVFMLPVAGFLLLAAIRWPVTQTAESSAAGELESPQAVRAGKVGPNSPCPCGSGKKYKKCHGAGISAKMVTDQEIESSLRRREMLRRAGFFLAMGAIAAVVIEALYFFPSDPFLYLTGLRKVNADHIASYHVYFHGELGDRFYLYYLTAWLLKEPAATVLLVAAGLVMLLRRKSTPILSKLFLLLPPAVFLVATTFLADDMGIRYLIPGMPFTCLLGGIGLAGLFGKTPVWGRYLAAALCVWVVVAAVGIYPDHLSYFNEAACLTEPARIGWDGGTRCGPQWLDDSNVDWGQGLKQLRSWMDRHGNGRTLRLDYFGTYPPQGYGVQFTKLENADLFGDPPPGLYGVSAQFVARMPTVGEALAPPAISWVRRTPLAIVGHALYIYEFH